MSAKKIKVSVGFTYFIEKIVDVDNDWEKIYEERKPLAEDEIKKEIASIFGKEGEVTNFFISACEQKMEGTDNE